MIYPRGLLEIWELSQDDFTLTIINSSQTIIGEFYSEIFFS